MIEFRHAWEKWHPDSAPVGYMMRRNDEPNWLRFHSLPGSKRYADSDRERDILLARQNTLANEVLGSGSAVWLAQTRWETPEGERDIADEETYFGACRNYGLSWSFRFLSDRDDEAPAWNVYATLTTWEPGKFDDLLWAIADEESGHMIWMAYSTGSVFAPYDSGVDLFLRDFQQVLELSTKHPHWLPLTPSGL